MVPARRDILPDRPLNDYERWLETQNQENNPDPSPHESQHVLHHHTSVPHGSFPAKARVQISDGLLSHQYMEYMEMASKLALLGVVLVVLARLVRRSRARHHPPSPRVSEVEANTHGTEEKRLL
ncbi:hypothetical protein BO70DRAFT_397574 [Aspergillus heteromorphus CBS 117.55]|uniref:Uncharacterized protein n=1 Tax=Aspergillus heteromorphus CBS 117.55 TaxID=1448321 RepID=A0A317VX32_9EURO|nr:uncharacterized protein BO70DRAFT_397574 [Aspergillus heteromorphus CBS 117.55]PWY78335.1 hypothetical protein BO70DRAFT_397574 [Aspergillus heteromorphus CBS 117.55]